jgi:hypothetical protein
VKRWFYIDIRKALDPSVDREEAILGVPEDRIVRSDFGRKVDIDVSTSKRDILASCTLFPKSLIGTNGRMVSTVIGAAIVRPLKISNITASPSSLWIDRLQRKGWMLARGDRRDFVAIDFKGGVHSVARCIEGAKAADVRQCFADIDPRDLKSVAETRQVQRQRQRECDRQGKVAKPRQAGQRLRRRPEAVVKTVKLVENGVSNDHNSVNTRIVPSIVFRPRRSTRTYRRLIRAVGALVLEQNDEWTVICRYMSLESLAFVSDDLLEMRPVSIRVNSLRL